MDKIILLNEILDFLEEEIHEIRDINFRRVGKVESSPDKKD